MGIYQAEETTVWDSRNRLVTQISQGMNIDVSSGVQHICMYVCMYMYIYIYEIFLLNKIADKNIIGDEARIGFEQTIQTIAGLEQSWLKITAWFKRHD